MAALHLINRPDADRVSRCLAAASPGDAVLFYEDAVHVCTSGGLARYKPLAADLTLLCLAHDAAVAGVALRLHPAVKAIDDAGFVDCVTRHCPVVAWT